MQIGQAELCRRTTASYTSVLLTDMHCTDCTCTDCRCTDCNCSLTGRAPPHRLCPRKPPGPSSPPARLPQPAPLPVRYALGVYGTSYRVGCGYVDTPPCKVRIVCVRRISQGGVRVYRCRGYPSTELVLSSSYGDVLHLGVATLPVREHTAGIRGISQGGWWAYTPPPCAVHTAHAWGVLQGGPCVHTATFLSS